MPTLNCRAVVVVVVVVAAVVLTRGSPHVPPAPAPLIPCTYVLHI